MTPKFLEAYTDCALVCSCGLTSSPLEVAQNLEIDAWICRAVWIHFNNYRPISEIAFQHKHTPTMKRTPLVLAIAVGLGYLVGLVSAGIHLNGVPSAVYWGCEYFIGWSGGDGTVRELGDLRRSCCVDWD